MAEQFFTERFAPGLAVFQQLEIKQPQGVIAGWPEYLSSGDFLERCGNPADNPHLAH